nr:serine hydrolase [Gordonia soli]
MVAVSLVATAALLAACGTDSTSGSSPSSSAAGSLGEELQNPAQVVGVPLPDNAVGNAVGKLDGLVQQVLDSTKIPGLAVAVVEGDQVRYAKGFGVTDVETGAKVDANTVFPLASLSKPVGSSVIAKLVTDDVVAWDTPVSANLPGFALADPYVTRTVTIADMYSHRSGLPDHAGDKLEDMGYDRQQIFDRFRFMPLSPYRITYDYTNFGLTAGAVSAANKAGKDWATLSQDLLYGPLGMTRTSSRYADFAGRSNRVVGHVKVDDKWVRTFKQREPDAQSPAGGVTSSVDDLTHWMKLLLANGALAGRDYIGEKPLLASWTPQIALSPPTSPDDRTSSYGFGYNLGVTAAGRTQISHSGAFGSGAATNLMMLPSANTAIVVLSNASPIGAVEALGAEFLDIVQFGEVKQPWQKLFGARFAQMEVPSGSLVGQQRPASPAPSAPLPSFVGTYANPVYGPFVVREQNGRLVLATGPNGMTTYELTPWDGNTFTFTIRTENAELGSISKVTFDGPRMTVEYYDDESSDGVFTRS